MDDDDDDAHDAHTPTTASILPSIAHKCTMMMKTAAATARRPHATMVGQLIDVERDTRGGSPDINGCWGDSDGVGGDGEV